MQTFKIERSIEQVETTHCGKRVYMVYSISTSVARKFDFFDRVWVEKRDVIRRDFLRMIPLEG